MVAINKFIDSPYFAFVLGALSLICHSFKIDIVWAYIFILMGIFVALFHKNQLALIPLMFFSTIGIGHKIFPDTPGYFQDPVIYIQCITLIAIAGIALLFRFTVYGEWKSLIKKAHLTTGFVFLTAALLLNGLFSHYYNFNDTVIAIGIAFCMYAPYAFFVNNVKWEKGKSLDYIAYTFLAVGVFVALQIFVKYMVTPELQDGSFNKNYLQFGWSGSNTMALFINFGIVFAFYHACKSDKATPFFFILAAVQLSALLLTMSRASLLVGAPMFLVLTVISCIIAKNRWSMLASASCLLILLTIIYCIWKKDIDIVFSAYADAGLDDSGRFKLWEEGWRVFKNAPVFGVGQDYLSTNRGTWFYSFHNTILHYLYTCGIVGLACYLFHRFTTVKLFIFRFDMMRLFVAAALCCMLFTSLLDLAMQQPYCLLYYSVLLAAAELDQRATPLSDKERERLKKRKARKTARVNFSVNALSLIPALA